MKQLSKLALLALGLSSQVAFAQIKKVNVKTMDQPANDMVLNTESGNILISIPSTDATNGNSIGFINPSSAQLTEHVFIGSEPRPIALTYNNKYLFVGLDGSKNIKRFDLASKTVGQTFSIGKNNSNSSYYANSISCMPSSESVIAVVRYTGGNSAGLAVYNNGAKLADTISESTPVDVAHFFNPNMIFGYNNASNGFDFSTMAINASGVKKVRQESGMMDGLNIDFHIQGDYAYSDDGDVVELTGGSTSSYGKCKIPTDKGITTLKACFDPYLTLVCFAGKGSGDSLFIYRFNPNTMLLQDVIGIPNVKGEVSKIINWGADSRYAISTKNGKITITDGITTSVRTRTASQLSVFPTSTSDKFYVSYSEPVNIEVLNQLGQVCFSSLNCQEASIAALPTGVYVLRLTNTKGAFLHSQHLIKE